MPPLDTNEHSEEVQDIMGQIPHWIIRRGITVLMGLLTFLLVGSYLFRYPDKVDANLFITTLNAPAPVVSNVNSRIEKWLVADNEIVYRDQTLAVLYSGDSFDEIQYLDSLLNLTNASYSYKALQSIDIPSLKLAIQELANQKLEYQNLLSSENYHQDTLGILSQIHQKTNFLAQMSEHKKLKQEEFELLRNKFKKDSTYYETGKYGISLSDYEQFRLDYIRNQSEHLRYLASFENHKEEIIALQRTLREAKQDHLDRIKMQEQNISESTTKLLSSIIDWKERFLLNSPVDGTISLTQYWSKNQVTAPGDQIATIIPEEEISVICRANLPPQYLGKIRQGQDVNIKLAAFPHLQYGILRGKISSISQIPYEDQYIVEIGLPSGVITDYGIKLPLIQEMTGAGEIITDKRRLIYKIIPSLEQLLQILGS